MVRLSISPHEICKRNTSEVLFMVGVSLTLTFCIVQLVTIDSLSCHSTSAIFNTASQILIGLSLNCALYFVFVPHCSASNQANIL